MKSKTNSCYKLHTAETIYWGRNNLNSPNEPFSSYLTTWSSFLHLFVPYFMCVCLPLAKLRSSIFFTRTLMYVSLSLSLSVCVCVCVSVCVCQWEEKVLISPEQESQEWKMLSHPDISVHFAREKELSSSRRSKRNGSAEFGFERGANETDFDVKIINLSKKGTFLSDDKNLPRDDETKNARKISWERVSIHSVNSISWEWRFFLTLLSQDRKRGITRIFSFLKYIISVFYLRGFIS